MVTPNQHSLRVSRASLLPQCIAHVTLVVWRCPQFDYSILWAIDKSAERGSQAQSALNGHITRVLRLRLLVLRSYKALQEHLVAR